MNPIKSILLFISLFPLLITIYIASLNTSKNVNLKILFWKFNQQSISTLILIGGSLGFTLSSLNLFLTSNKLPFSKQRLTTKPIGRINAKENYEDD